MGEPSHSGPWDFFDRVYCISVAEREDRRQEAQRQFEAVGLAGRVEFLIVKKHSSDPEQGCYESHLECFRRGLKAGASTLLIFEDDVVFDRFRPEALAGAVRFLSAPCDWQMFFLGCLSSGSRRTGNPAVMAVRYRSLTHAYAVRAGFAKTLLATPRAGLPYDGLLRALKGRYYAAYPSFAFQSDAATDNERTRRLDRLRRLCGGLRRIQKMDEWYHRNRVAVVGVHLFLIALAVVLLI